MNLVGRAVWYIESHFAEEISLEDIAAACDVSRFHISRAFGLATGRSVMRYARARRLTEAARSLSLGVPDILSVALDAGYGSHEAFTRAFRDQFGVTPEAVRSCGGLDHLELMEPVVTNENVKTKLEEPRREARGQLLIVGSRARYTFGTIAGIPMQWQRFGPFIGTIPARVDKLSYGVCCEFDDTGHYDYVCGVAVSRVVEPPSELTTVRIAARDYLVFTHSGHISSIPGTWHAIMNDWLPASSCRMPDAPGFEPYSEDFDADTGMGGVEIWIPIEA
jgi:AraC family transcriptional regulator